MGNNANTAIGTNQRMEERVVKKLKGRKSGREGNGSQGQKIEEGGEEKPVLNWSNGNR